MNAILSIKPKYAQAILNGQKLVEFRKKVFKNEVERVYIYSSSPIQKIVGYFTIEEIVKASPIELWAQFEPVGAIDQKSFFDYFSANEEGYSICIGAAFEFLEHINPHDYLESFTAPQSYCYTDIEL